MVAIATPVTAKDMKFDVKKREEMKCPAVDVLGDRLVEGFSGDDKITIPVSILGFEQDTTRKCRHTLDCKHECAYS